MTSVLILGDVGVDKYFHCVGRELSPDDPYPIVQVNTTSENLSCAGNVAKNVNEFFENVFLITCLKESDGQRIKEYLSDKVTHTNVQQADRGIRVINRILNGNHCLSRFDEGKFVPINEESESKIIRLISQFDHKVNVVILTDYNQGFLSPNLCEKVICFCNFNDIPVFVDPHLQNWGKFRNATLIKPNREEASSFLGKPISSDIVGEVAKDLIENYNISYVLCTLDKDGMVLGYRDRNEENFIKIIAKPIIPTPVVDVVGCGDTLIAALAALYSENNRCFADLSQKVVDHLTKVGSVAVSKPGCYHLNRSDWNIIVGKPSNRTVVFTNGCFDILHPAHIWLLKECKRLGDYLIIGINSDNSVKRSKGPSRPINTLSDRMIMLIELELANEIIPFEEDTPLNLIKRIRPDLLVKGGDYFLEEVVGREFARETVTITGPFTKHFSSTKIISRCVNNNMLTASESKD